MKPQKHWFGNFKKGQQNEKYLDHLKNEYGLTRGQLYSIIKMEIVITTILPLNQ